MADPTTAALLQLGDRIPDQDRDCVARMLSYLNRSNLWLAACDGRGDELILYVANEAERFRIPLTQLRDLWHGLKDGQRIDWDQLERVR